MIYSRRDIAVLAYAAGLLTGAILAFASCSPPDEPGQQHITTGAHQ